MFIFSSPPKAAKDASVEPSYYDHGHEPIAPRKIVVLKDGYIFNTAIPQGRYYRSEIAVVPGTDVYSLRIFNSNGQIVSELCLPWKAIARMEKQLLSRAKKSIFVGGPYYLDFLNSNPGYLSLLGRSKGDELGNPGERQGLGTLPHR